MRNILTRSLLSCLLIIGAELFFSTGAFGQATAKPKIQVIPRPRQLKIINESFRLIGSSIVVLADPRSEADRFAAEDFVADLKETSGVVVRIGKGRKQAILVGSLAQPAIVAALKRASLEPPANLDSEGYLLSVDANEVVVAGQSDAGVFYGLQTLKQLVQGEAGDVFIPGVQITDWPAPLARRF